MLTALELRKQMRGTKRVCQSCEVRFYDLSREPIVCPSCGAPYTPEVRPPVRAVAGASSAGKTSWRSNGFKRPTPAVADASPERAASKDAAANEELEVEAEEAAVATDDDDEVLEQDSDDADVTGLVDHDIEEPKER